MYGKAWSSLGRLLDPITQDACAFYEDHGLFDDYTGVVYETSEGDRIAQTLGHSKAVILRNHGLLTVGQTIDEAAWWFITMDRSCHAQLLAEAAGKPIQSRTSMLSRPQSGRRLIRRVVPVPAPLEQNHARRARPLRLAETDGRACASQSYPTSTATGPRLRRSWRICGKPLPT